MIFLPEKDLLMPANSCEIHRKDLIDAILSTNNDLIYIHAAGGYGKSTLISQLAQTFLNTVVINLSGEPDVYSFVENLCDATHRACPDFVFTASEYLPFEKEKIFNTILANALINSFKTLSIIPIIVFDNLESVKTSSIRSFISTLVANKPKNIKFCFSSRQKLWQELTAYRERILEITSQQLAITKSKAIEIIGYEDKSITEISQGYPIAISAYRVLMENGVLLENGLSSLDLTAIDHDRLPLYLFKEIMKLMPSKLIDFLINSACFEEINTVLLDRLLEIKNSRLILESLYIRNMFTMRNVDGSLCYQPLFREFLLEYTSLSKKKSLLTMATNFYLEKEDYYLAAKYAILSDNKEILQKIILKCYRDYIKSGNFSALRIWFQAIEEKTSLVDIEILVAQGEFFSYVGDFDKAKTYFDSAIPFIKEEDKELYTDAIVHKARVIRNLISIEDSNQVLDELILKLEIFTFETAYKIIIEKIYNLCRNSQVNEAYALAKNMIERCAKYGNLKVKAWYERYLTAIHFFAGRMKDAVYYYEKSLELPEKERQYLDMYNVGIYAAKAYQIIGDTNKAITLITDELLKLKSTNRYEDLWGGYLFASEIYLNNNSIDKANNLSQSFENTMKCFKFAFESSTLYRNTKFQIVWIEMQLLINNLICSDNKKEDVINRIFANLGKANNYLKTIALGKLAEYFEDISDLKNSILCAKQCIQAGEKSNLMLMPTLAYGVLAHAAISINDKEQATKITKRYLQLCAEYGIYGQFKMRKSHKLILEFAFENEIELDFTKSMMDFSCQKIKKIYIKTFGSFSVTPYTEKHNPLKMRTKKERELLAYILNAGNEGVTKDQIYNALWSKSNSKDIKKLIGVNLAHIKKDLAILGVDNPIVNHNKYYSVCRGEIISDITLFEEAAKEFTLDANTSSAQKIISLYNGDYLSDFEAPWVIERRARYKRIYESALFIIQTSPGKV